MGELERRFCGEYLLDLDAGAAALRAGYPARTAARAPEWLTPGSEGYRPRLSGMVRRAMAERARRTGINPDRVLREYARIAFASLADVVDLRGGLALRADISADAAAAIASVKYKAGANGAVDCDIRMYDKMTALELVARHLGMAADVPAGGEMPRITALADGSVTVDGGEA